MSKKAQDDIDWWMHHLQRMNGQPIQRGQPSLVIRKDASLQWWGARCRHHNIGGPWRPTEKDLHINWLELLGASHAVKALCEGKTNMTVQLKNGQLNSNCLHRPPRRDQVISSMLNHNRPVGVVSRSQDLSVSISRPRGTEYISRLPLPFSSQQTRLGVEQEYIQETEYPVGSLSSGLVCNKSHVQLPRFSVGNQIIKWKPSFRASRVMQTPRGRCIQHINCRKRQ